MPTVPLEIPYLERAADIVKRGGLIVYPTDTVYALGCDPFNKEAVEKIFKVKGRKNKGLPVLVPSLREALRLAYFPRSALKIVEKYWPGQVTLVLKRNENAPDFLGGNPAVIGLRMPCHALTLELVAFSGECLIGTSANRSGLTPAVTAAEAEKQLGGEVDLIIDGGETFIGKGSTVVDLSNGRLDILRAGPVSRRQLMKLLEEI